LLFLYLKPSAFRIAAASLIQGVSRTNFFELTDQERQQWQAKAEAIMKEYDAAHQPDQEGRQTQDTEPLTPILVVEYTA
jgi:hypothetical protein